MAEKMDMGGVVALGVAAFAIYQLLKRKDSEPGKLVIPGATLFFPPDPRLSDQQGSRVSGQPFRSQAPSFPPGSLLQLVAYIENTSKYQDGTPAPFTFYQLIYSVWEGSILPGHGTLLHQVLNSVPLNFGPGDKLAVYSEVYQEVQGTINRRDVGLKLYASQQNVVADHEWDDVYQVDPIPTAMPGAAFFLSPAAVPYSFEG